MLARMHTRVTHPMPPPPQTKHELSPASRGWLYYQMKDYVSAKRVLKRAVATDGDESIFRFHLGMTYYMLGDKTSAKTELEKSLASDATFVGSDKASELVKKL